MDTTTHNELTATIPFQGFYNSYFDDVIDRTLEDIFNPSCGEGAVPDGAHRIDSRKTFAMIAKTYAEAYIQELRSETGLELKSLEFESMDSPREYNFSTDRLFITLSAADAVQLSRAAEGLPKLVKDKFTSYDGFRSFYANDLAGWPEDVAEWDHNQIGTAIEACYSPNAMEQYELVGDDLLGNGLVSDEVWDALPANLKALAERLREEERDYIEGEELTA